MTHNLNRFITAQESIYEMVTWELRMGCKYLHWMWYIFPQFEGLGYSNRAKKYSIKSLAEAKAYLAHPILGERLIECSQLILNIENKTISQILGYPDDLKLQSSMTLFDSLSDNEIFNEVLEKYFDGEKDSKTLELMGNLKK